MVDVLKRETGQLGPFEVRDGNLKANARKLAVWFNDKTLLIDSNVRAGFTPEQHVAFDELLYVLRTAGVTFSYIDGLHTFFNPRAQLSRFIADSDPARFAKIYGLELTPEELGYAATKAKYEAELAALQTSLQAKFDAVFTAPTPAYQFQTSVDIKEAVKQAGLVVSNDTELELIENWLNGSGTYDNAPRLLTRLASFNAKKYTLLRVKGKYVENSTGHRLGLKTAEALARFALDQWRNEETNFTRLSSYVRYNRRVTEHYSARSAEIYKDYIEIGCQRIPRSEIERIAKQQGWVS